MIDTPEVLEHLRKKPVHPDPRTSTQAQRDTWRRAFIKWDAELTTLRIGPLKKEIKPGKFPGKFALT